MKHANILLVEDDSFLREGLQYVLEMEGFRVTPAEDGQVAWELFRSAQSTSGDNWIDLIITDIKMPRMDGLQLLGKVRSVAPSLPVLLLTGHTDGAELASADNKVAQAFIEKPFDVEVVINAIKHSLAN